MPRYIAEFRIKTEEGGFYTETYDIEADDYESACDRAAELGPPEVGYTAFGIVDWDRVLREVEEG